ncbi:MAG: RpiB/LacA/LacB family sugar-phosphate isomerase [Candidatus Micrarchaeota archaeon]|nr:RpiB/LacA/LacB family sugar-phosphate isomerase [Candidatus Micrarchaeota archaeon]
MKIFVGSDHRGFELKKSLITFLEKLGFTVVDVGPRAYDPNDDYPDFAEQVCKGVLASKEKGILICGSGNGMARAANKIPGIYASLCWDEDTARSSMNDGNTNVLCLSASASNTVKAKRIVKAWLSTPFSNEERHMRRVDKVKDIERRYAKP